MARLTRAQKTALAKALGFLQEVRVDVRGRRKRDRLEILAREKYDEVAFIARLGLADRASKIVNRVALALREGRITPDFKDVAKLQSIVGEAMSEHRATLVMRNALATAYNAGRFEQQLRDPTRSYLLYRTMGDSLVRPSHARLERILLPKNHPFWKTYYPPNGHGCRCRVDSLTKKQAEELVSSRSVRTTPPRERQIKTRDNITGKIITTPESIDAGWAGAPSSDPERFAKQLERTILRIQQAG